jgi:hypothetical protein
LVSVDAAVNGDWGSAQFEFGEKKKPGGEAGPSPVHANLSAEHTGRINDTGCRKQPDGDQS